MEKEKFQLNRGKFSSKFSTKPDNKIMGKQKMSDFNTNVLEEVYSSDFCLLKM